MKRLGNRMRVEKVTIYPCGGIGLHVSCVARLSGYLVQEELLPEYTEILDMHRLIAGASDEVRLVEEYPTILLDGCAHQCGLNFLRLLGIKPAAGVYTPGMIKLTGLTAGRHRKVLEESGQQLSRRISELVAKLARDMVETADYSYVKQRIRARGLNICDYSLDMVEAMNMIRVADAIYRSEDMPPLPNFEK